MRVGYNFWSEDALEKMAKCNSSILSFATTSTTTHVPGLTQTTFICVGVGLSEPY